MTIIVLFRLVYCKETLNPAVAVAVVAEWCLGGILLAVRILDLEWYSTTGHQQIPAVRKFARGHPPERRRRRNPRVLLRILFKVP